MQSNAATVEDYLAELPEDRRAAISTIRDTINAHLPEGYVEQMGFGMINWVIPLSDYPDTYNKQPLGVAALASQKNHMAIYLLGLYTTGDDEQWFRQQYADREMKLDMGKSCVRFTQLDEVPLDVLGQVIERVPPQRHIDHYETARGIR